jgi:hypothetical protein
MGTYYIPDNHLDDFVNHRKPEKNNRNRKIINQEQFRFIGKDYDFPYQKMRDELFANYKKKRAQPPPQVTPQSDSNKPPQPPQSDSNKPKDGKKKWTKKNNGKPKSAVPQVNFQADSQQQSLSVPQAKPQMSAPQNSSDNSKLGKSQEKKFKKFQNKSK